MSKRSYRRLAAVTGAALALGTMAPAMAARVNSNSTADVEVTDVNLPSVDTSAATDLLGGVSGLAFTTLDSTQDIALTTVGGLQSDVLGIVGNLLSGSLASLNVDADVNVLGSGGSVGATGLLDGDGLLGIVPAPGELVGTALGVASPVLQVAGPVVNTALNAPALAIGLVSGAPDIVFGLVDSLSLTAGGNASVGSSLLGIF